MEKFIKFGFVGIINTVINWVVYNILLYCPYRCSAAIRKDGKNVIFRRVKE